MTIISARGAAPISPLRTESDHGQAPPSKTAGGLRESIFLGLEIRVGPEQALLAIHTTRVQALVPLQRGGQWLADGVAQMDQQPLFLRSADFFALLPKPAFAQFDAGF